MTMQWYFNQPKPGDKNREPALGEFFATEAIQRQHLYAKAVRTHLTLFPLRVPMFIGIETPTKYGSASKQ